MTAATTRAALGDVDFGSRKTGSRLKKACFFPKHLRVRTLREGGPEAIALAWAHLPAVEVKNPQPEREVGLHGWVLRATGDEADGAHRWPALSRAAQSLERELGATPALPGQQAVR